MVRISAPGPTRRPARGRRASTLSRTCVTDAGPLSHRHRRTVAAACAVFLSDASLRTLQRLDGYQRTADERKIVVTATTGLADRTDRWIDCGLASIHDARGTLSPSLALFGHRHLDHLARSDDLEASEGPEVAQGAVACHEVSRTAVKRRGEHGIVVRVRGYAAHFRSRGYRDRLAADKVEEGASIGSSHAFREEWLRKCALGLA
jgi:hypothetical protein